MLLEFSESKFLNVPSTGVSFIKPWRFSCYMLWVRCPYSSLITGLSWTQEEELSNEHAEITDTEPSKKMWRKLANIERFVGIRRLKGKFVYVFYWI